MRILLPFAAFGILLAAYSGYWLYLSHTLGETISELRVRWHEAGVEVKHGELSVGGYPYRIEVTARDVEAAGQNGSVNWRWRTPILQATAHPWKLSHWVAVVETPSDIDFSLTNDWSLALMVGRGRISVNVGADAFLERVSFDLRDLRMQPNVGSDYVDINRAELHVRRAPMKSPSLDVAVFIKEMAFGQTHSYTFGNRLQELNAEISLKGPMPVTWSRMALDGWRDAGGVVEVHSLQMLWGNLEVQVDGTFAIDEAYRPIGAASATIKGYASLLAALRMEGIVSEPAAFAAGLALDLLAEPAPDDGRGLLRVPITLQDGHLHVGPVPLMPLGPVIDP